jgi:mannose-6-phosphate isomerase
MNTISILKNPIQAYSWGSKTEIQKLIGEPESTGKHIAELWMGAHPKAPSEVLLQGKWQSLDEVIKKNPESILGEKTARRFSNELPFLFKVLAADKPLSVQAHPNIEQAQQGFSNENNLGIPINAPNRNYKDDKHKPEILCALTPFQVLKGFRKIEEILHLINTLSLSTLSDELNVLQKNPNSNGLKSFFSALMSMDKRRRKDVTSEAVRSAEKFTGEDNAYGWMVELDKEYPGDIGILSPVLLNLILLEAGEAVYLRSGELHTYLHGLGIELMANSDNVLRGGLTPKHIDVPALLNTVNFETGPPQKVKVTNINTCRMIYETPAEEFLLSLIAVNEDNPYTSHSDRSVEILICLKGEAAVEDVGRREVLSVKRGQSIIVPSEIPHYQIGGNAMLYMASVNF